MFAVPAGERRSDMRANDGMTRELGGRGGRIGAEQRLAAADIQPGQRADILAVGTGDDGVLEHRRAGANDTDAQQSDMHPDAAQGGNACSPTSTAIGTFPIPVFGQYAMVSYGERIWYSIG